MARHEDITVNRDWVELTNANVTALTLQLVDGQQIALTAVVDGNPPAADDWSGLRIYEGQGFQGVELADLFPGAPGANRVFARSDLASARVFVSHA